MVNQFDLKILCTGNCSPAKECTEEEKSTQILNGPYPEVMCYGGWGRTCRAGKSLMGFPSESLVFVQKRANERFAQKNERFTHPLIFGEQPERFAHFL